ncbi:MAG: DUF3188 domain-containing protein [Cyanobacteriota bacterium]|nr:DUF3188 domain-containing protein [Cyanobacteriota bacterium]
MKERTLLLSWLALAAPLLVLLALLALLTRTGPGRLQAVPALLIGMGLVGTSVVARRRQRRRLLLALRQRDD